MLFKTTNLAFRGDQVFLLATVMYDFAIYDSVRCDCFQFNGTPKWPNKGISL